MYFPVQDWLDKPERYIYLGSEVNPYSGQKYDYYCVKTHESGDKSFDYSPTARHGKEPPDYTSGPLSVSWYNHARDYGDFWKTDYIWGWNRVQKLALYFLATGKKPLLEQKD